jgi:hypothetical protein
MTGYDPTKWGVQNAPSVMACRLDRWRASGRRWGGQPNFYDQSSSTLNGMPSWEQWRQFSPRQGGVPTDIEALGPGAWNQMSDALGSQFQGRAARRMTQMQAAGAGPTGQAGMQMTGELVGPRRSSGATSACGRLPGSQCQAECDWTAEPSGIAA